MRKFARILYDKYLAERQPQFFCDVESCPQVAYERHPMCAVSRLFLPYKIFSPLSLRAHCPRTRQI